MIRVLTGENSHSLQLSLDERIDKFSVQYGDLAIEKLDAEEVSYSALLAALQGMAFLAPNKLVIIKQFTASKELTENIESVLKTIPDSTEVLLVANKLDKRTQYYKLLKSQAEIEEFSNLDERGLAAWLTKTAKESGGQLSLNNAIFLVSRVGSDQALLHNELQKLLSYNPSITRETITELCEPLPQSSVFDLLEAAFNGDKKKAIKLYEDQRKQSVEPLAILAMVGWQLQTMAIVAAAKDKSADQIAKEARLHPFVVRKTLNLVQKRPLSSIKNLVRQTLQLDAKLKSITIDSDDALQHFLLNLSN